MVPRKLISHELIMSPTFPPNGNDADESTKESMTEKINNPMVTYFKFLQIENTFLSNRRLMPTTKKKVQKRKEERPNPLRMKLCAAKAPSLPSRLLTFTSLSTRKPAPLPHTCDWSSSQVKR